MNDNIVSGITDSRFAGRLGELAAAVTVLEASPAGTYAQAEVANVLDRLAKALEGHAFGLVREGGVITIRIPEVWVLVDENGNAQGIRRADTHPGVFTEEEAHRLFSKGRQLLHEDARGWRVIGMEWRAGHDAFAAAANADRLDIPVGAL